MLKILRKKGQKGFTLVEVMITICVLILGAILIAPKYQIYMAGTYDRQARAELKSYYTACQAYLANNPTLEKACTVAQISGKFVKSPQVNIVPAGDSTCRGTTAQHFAPNAKLYTIQRDGEISPSR